MRDTVKAQAGRVFLCAKMIKRKQRKIQRRNEHQQNKKDKIEAKKHKTHKEKIITSYNATDCLLP